MMRVRTPVAAILCLPVLLPAISGCDFVTAGHNAQETAEWRKSYELQPVGRVEIRNVNGKIEVEPSTGNRVEIVAVKSARGATPEAAREALRRIEIRDSASPSAVRIETKLARGAGGFTRTGGGEVRYTVKVPASADVQFSTVNGGIELIGLGGRITAESTNGGIDVDITRVAAPGVTLECTNGGIKLRLPGKANATISASVTNGGIDAGNLAIATSESSRRRLEGQLNGGGPPIRIAGTNGGIRLSAR